jgi:hypothetical protein
MSKKRGQCEIPFFSPICDKSRGTNSIPNGLVTGDGQDTLTLLFLNRTVSITGKGLRQLALSLQDCCVEFIKPLSERYVSLPGDEVSVKTIEIEENKENNHA